MTTPADLELRTVVDRAAIEALFYKYCDALDLREWELLEQVFAPTVVTHWPTGLESQRLDEMHLEGREQVIDWLRQIFEDFGPTHHIVSNLVVELGASSAAVTCRVRAYHSAKASDLFEESLARFSATATRTDDGWRFVDFREVVPIALGNLHEISELAVERGLMPET